MPDFHQSPLPAARGKRSAARVLLALAAALAATLAVGCGGDDDGGAQIAGQKRGDVVLSERTEATLVLDFLPNAVHTGIYRAVAQGYYADNNIDLEIIEPSSTADTLKLIVAGRADFGIADGSDVANQIAQQRGARGIMALVQRPLGGLIALEESGVRRPADLVGRKVGVTGIPSDHAVLETILEHNDVDPDRVDTVTIGFNGVQALEGGRIPALIGFIAADGTQLELDGFPIRAWPLDENGGPQYPGLVVFSTAERIDGRPELMRAFVDATVRGYTETIEDPDAALGDLLAENPTLERRLARAQLDAYLPLFRAEAPAFGVIQPDNVEALSDFMVEHELIDEPFSVERYGTNRFVPGAS